MASETDAVTVLEGGGYTCYNSGELHKMIMMIGASDSGKSSLITLLASLFGIKNIRAIALQKLEANQFSASNLIGKFANLSADNPITRMPDPAFIRELVAEDPVELEAKFQDSEVKYITAVFWVAAEKFSSIVGATKGFYRRLIAPQFHGPIPKDKQIHPKKLNAHLCAQRDGIITLFNLYFRGVLLREPGRFTESEASKNKIKQYELDGNWFKQFAHDCIKSNKNVYIRKTEVRDIFKLWWLFNINDGDQAKQESKEGKPPASGKLYSELESLFPTMKKSKTHFVGIECNLPAHMVVATAEEEQAMAAIDTDGNPSDHIKELLQKQAEELAADPEAHSQWKDKWVNINNGYEWVDAQYGSNDCDIISVLPSKDPESSPPTTSESSDIDDNSNGLDDEFPEFVTCLLYTSPSPRD